MSVTLFVSLLAVGVINTGRILVGERADHAIRDTVLIVGLILVLLFIVHTYGS